MELLLCALFQYRKASVDQVKLGGVGGTLLTEDELNGAGTRRDVVFIGQAHVIVDRVYDSMQVRILGADGRMSTGDMDHPARYFVESMPASASSRRPAGWPTRAARPLPTS